MSEPIFSWSANSPVGGGAVTLGQPIVGQVLCDAVCECFASEDSVSSRAIVETCNKIPGFSIQSSEGNR